jgi:hypothetical protein
MSEAKTYTGSCHCGSVRFEATTDLAKVTACNCSICSRAGWLLAFVPASQFKLISGEENLTDYQFAKQHVHHTFCRTCGVRPFSHGASASGAEVRAVNVRCLDGVDPAALTISHFDGRSL